MKKILSFLRMLLTAVCFLLTVLILGPVVDNGYTMWQVLLIGSTVTIFLYWSLGFIFDLGSSGKRKARWRDSVSYREAVEDLERQTESAKYMLERDPEAKWWEWGASASRASKKGKKEGEDYIRRMKMRELAGKKGLQAKESTTTLTKVCSDCNGAGLCVEGDAGAEDFEGYRKGYLSEAYNSSISDLDNETTVLIRAADLYDIRECHGCCGTREFYDIGEDNTYVIGNGLSLR